VFSGDQSGIVRDFQGTYTEYLQYRRDESQRIKSEVKASKKEAVAQEVVAPVTPTITAATPTSAAAAAAANPLTYNERKEYNKLEKEISKLENQVKEFDLKINSSNGKEGYSVLAEWSAELNKLKELMATKEEKWLAYHARDV
jgi:ATP-binding cassette subfamily F protein uup